MNRTCLMLLFYINSWGPNDSETEMVGDIFSKRSFLIGCIYLLHFYFGCKSSFLLEEAFYNVIIKNISYTCSSIQFGAVVINLIIKSYLTFIAQIILQIYWHAFVIWIHFVTENSRKWEYLISQSRFGLYNTKTDTECS